MKQILAFCFLAFLFSSCVDEKVEQPVRPDGSLVLE